MGPLCIDDQEIENEEYCSEPGMYFVHVTRLFAAIVPIFKLICGV